MLLQFLLNLKKVTARLRHLTVGESSWVVAVILEVSAVVHSEREGEHGGTLGEHVMVYTAKYLERGVPADAAVVHPHACLRKARHVVEPYVRVIMSAVGYAVADECHTVAALERRHLLRRRT